MLYYLEEVTEYLACAVLVIGMIDGYFRDSYSKKGSRIILAGQLLGFACSCIMAYMKNHTNLIDTSAWNVRLFILGLVGTGVFFIFSIPGVRVILKDSRHLCAKVGLAALSFSLMVHGLTDVIGAPHVAGQAESTLLSTDYLFKLIGIALGALLGYLIALAVSRSFASLRGKASFIILSFVLALNAFRFSLGILHVAISKRWIESNHTLFLWIKFYTNQSDLFIYGGMVGCIAAVIFLYILSFIQKEPYRNSAQHRKIRAKWRNIRRWGALVIVCFVCMTFNLTVVHALNSKKVELSPVEECEETDDAVYIDVTKLEDGHLHRFAIYSDSGVEIRFIAILKTNGKSYAVGMDACEICGETGYYEKDDQVICKLCDVAMNINTIGFKGGCNPLVVDYEVREGNIVILKEDLLAYEDEFA